MLSLGIKSDPIEYRYSFRWLFELMQEKGIQLLQLGSFFELYHLPDSYFKELAGCAAEYGVHIKSCFTAHRELGGFFSGDRRMEAVARRCYERYIDIASLLGADFAGSNPGAVYRDMREYKEQGISCYIRHVKALMHRARDRGLKALTVEPMSSLAEPPSTPEEIIRFMDAFSRYHARFPDSTVPVFLCADTSHGLVDEEGSIVYNHIELFTAGIPWTAEFHFKNTDLDYNATFGFSEEERKRGVVRIDEVLSLIRMREDALPLQECTGYLELGGPKLGRDYSDHRLREMLMSSIDYLQERISCG